MSSRLRLLACCAPALFAACGKDDTTVYGRWYRGGDTLEFFPGGRLIVHEDESWEGSYELVGRNRMRLVNPAVVSRLPTDEYRITLTADSLTFCDLRPSPFCPTYARVTADSAQDAGEATLAAEPEAVLRQAYLLQQTYRVKYGHFATDWESLEELGWEPPSLRHFQPPRMVVSGEWFCITLEPSARGAGSAMHIDEQGELERGADCH